MAVTQGWFVLLLVLSAQVCVHGGGSCMKGSKTRRNSQIIPTRDMSSHKVRSDELSMSKKTQGSLGSSGSTTRHTAQPALVIEPDEELEPCVKRTQVDWEETNQQQKRLGPEFVLTRMSPVIPPGLEAKDIHKCERETRLRELFDRNDVCLDAYKQSETVTGSSTARRPKAVIFGAAPAGLFAAIQLAKTHDVVVLDKYLSGSRARFLGLFSQERDFLNDIGMDVTQTTYFPQGKRTKRGILSADLDLGLSIAAMKLGVQICRGYNAVIEPVTAEEEEADMGSLEKRVTYHVRVEAGRGGVASGLCPTQAAMKLDSECIKNHEFDVLIYGGGSRNSMLWKDPSEQNDLPATSFDSLAVHMRYKALRGLMFLYSRLGGSKKTSAAADALREIDQLMNDVNKENYHKPLKEIEEVVQRVLDLPESGTASGASQRRRGSTKHSDPSEALSKREELLTEEEEEEEEVSTRDADHLRDDEDKSQEAVSPLKMEVETTGRRDSQQDSSTSSKEDEVDNTRSERQIVQEVHRVLESIDDSSVAWSTIKPKNTGLTQCYVAPTAFGGKEEAIGTTGTTGTTGTVGASNSEHYMFSTKSRDSIQLAKEIQEGAFGDLPNFSPLLRAKRRLVPATSPSEVTTRVSDEVYQFVESFKNYLFGRDQTRVASALAFFVSNVPQTMYAGYKGDRQAISDAMEKFVPDFLFLNLGVPPTRASPSAVSPPFKLASSLHMRRRKASHTEPQEEDVEDVVPVTSDNAASLFDDVSSPTVGREEEVTDDDDIDIRRLHWEGPLPGNLYKRNLNLLLEKYEGKGKITAPEIRRRFTYDVMNVLGTDIADQVGDLGSVGADGRVSWIDYQTENYDDPRQHWQSASIFESDFAASSITDGTLLHSTQRFFIVGDSRQDAWYRFGLGVHDAFNGVMRVVKCLNPSVSQDECLSELHNFRNHESLRALQILHGVYSGQYHFSQLERRNKFPSSWMDRARQATEVYLENLQTTGTSATLLD